MRTLSKNKQITIASIPLVIFVISITLPFIPALGFSGIAYASNVSLIAAVAGFIAAIVTKGKLRLLPISVALIALVFNYYLLPTYLNHIFDNWQY